MSTDNEGKRYQYMGLSLENVTEEEEEEESFVVPSNKDRTSLLGAYCP